jgi:heterodisulfide reductase subunit C
MCAFDIIENDMFDAVVSEKKEKKSNVELEALKEKIKSYPNALEVMQKVGKKLSECNEEELKKILSYLEKEKESK